MSPLLRKKKESDEELMVKQIFMRRVDPFRTLEDQFLTLYNDDDTPSWQPRSCFIDIIDGEEHINEKLEEFEASLVKEDTIKKVQPTQKRKLSPASQAIFEHSNALASQAVSSADVSGSTEDLKSITKKIKTETKQEIRQAGITQREAVKNETSAAIKSHLSQQEQTQQFSQLLQLQTIKMMSKIFEEDSEKENIKNKVMEDVVCLKSEVGNLKESLAQILSILKERPTNNTNS